MKEFHSAAAMVQLCCRFCSCFKPGEMRRKGNQGPGILSGHQDMHFPFSQAMGAEVQGTEDLVMSPTCPLHLVLPPVTPQSAVRHADSLTPGTHSSTLFMSVCPL